MIRFKRSYAWPLFALALLSQAAVAADFTFPSSAPSTVLTSACTNTGALDRIVDRFAWAERTQWHRGFVIDTISNPRPSGHPFAEPGLVERDYCMADSVMTNGNVHPVYYTIEHGLGFAGIGRYVDFCVLGLDPWHVHDGDCRTVRQKLSISTDLLWVAEGGVLSLRDWKIADETEWIAVLRAADAAPRWHVHQRRKGAFAEASGLATVVPLRVPGRFYSPPDGGIYFDWSSRGHPNAPSRYTFETSHRPRHAAYALSMRQRYLAQRDPDGTWSVRELETNCPAIFLNQLMVGMTEMEAVLTVRKFHALDHIEAFAGTSQAPSQAAQRAG